MRKAVTGLLFTALLVGSGSAAAAGAQPMQTSPARLARPLDDKLRSAGIIGEGTHRIEVVPGKIFQPRTLTEGPLQAKQELAVEIERLRSSGAADRASARAPTSALKGLLRENQVAERPQPFTRELPSAGLPAKHTGKPGAADDRERYALYAVASRESSPGSEPGAGRQMVVFDQDPEFNFAAFRGAGVPFHVFDVDPSQTILVELSGDEVARVRKQDKDWAWIQLDSGLMGLVRNHHVKAAGEFEILKYLAMEYGKKKEAGLLTPGEEGRVRVNQVQGAYEVAEAPARKVPEARPAPETTAPGREFEILRNLALEYGRKKERGELPPDGGSRVRVSLVDGSYQVTEEAGRDAPAPRIGTTRTPDKAQLRLPEQR